MEHLKNPFFSQSDVKPDFAGLGDVFLSPEDAAKLRALETRREVGSRDVERSKQGLGIAEFGLELEDGMTAEERAKFQEVKELRETRKRLIAWADEFNLGGEEWVDETFTFNADGTAICEGNLFLQRKGISYFPKGIKEVRGYLDLAGNQITKIENLPASVSGNLDLAGNQITKIENLPASVRGDLWLNNNQITKIENLPASIRVDLWLRGIPAKQMQAGVRIGGIIYLSHHQTELRQDAESKGYKVVVL